MSKQEIQSFSKLGGTRSSVQDILSGPQFIQSITRKIEKLERGQTAGAKEVEMATALQSETLEFVRIQQAIQSTQSGSRSNASNPVYSDRSNHKNRPSRDMERISAGHPAPKRSSLVSPSSLSPCGCPPGHTLNQLLGNCYPDLPSVYNQGRASEFNKDGAPSRSYVLAGGARSQHRATADESLHSLTRMDPTPENAALDPATSPLSPMSPVIPLQTYRNTASSTHKNSSRFSHTAESPVGGRGATPPSKEAPPRSTSPAFRVTDLSANPLDRGVQSYDGGTAFASPDARASFFGRGKGSAKTTGGASQNGMRQHHRRTSLVDCKRGDAAGASQLRRWKEGSDLCTVMFIRKLFSCFGGGASAAARVRPVA